MSEIKVAKQKKNKVKKNIQYIDNINKAIGRKVRILRLTTENQYGKTASLQIFRQLFCLSGASSVSSKEKGLSPFSIAELYILAQYYDIQMEYFFTDLPKDNSLPKHKDYQKAAHQKKLPKPFIASVQNDK